MTSVVNSEIVRVASKISSNRSALPAPPVPPTLGTNRPDYYDNVDASGPVFEGKNSDKIKKGHPLAEVGTPKPIESHPKGTKLKRLISDPVKLKNPFNPTIITPDNSKYRKSLEYFLQKIMVPRL